MKEIHTIQLADSVLYNSNNGIVGDSFGASDVMKGVQFTQGTTVGVKFNPATRTVHFFYNRHSIGSCHLRPEKAENLQTLYPVFALYLPKQQITVDFKALLPEHT